jgi:hypothetical protein
MAVGPITNPATWLNGTVIQASFLQNVMDNINNPGNVTFSGLVVDGAGGVLASPTAGAITYTQTVTWQYVISGHGLAVNLGTFTAASWGWTANGSGILICPIEIPFAANASTTLTTIAVRVTQGGATNMTVNLQRTTNINNTSATSTSTIATANSAGSGEQIITLSSLGLTGSAGNSYGLQVQTFNSGDKVYGVTLTFSRTGAIVPGA